jgi:RES domain-containing protein
MVISLPDDPCFLTQIHQNQLPVNWRRMSAYAECQRIGSQWVDTCSTLLLKLPSAIVPMEFNVAINADHPEFDHQVRLVRTEPYFWDERWMP